MTRDDIISMAREAGIHVYPEFEACRHPYPSHAGAALTVCADAIRARGAQ